MKSSILQAPPITDVRLGGPFWGQFDRDKLIGMIRHQYTAFTNTMHKDPTSGALHSLQLLSGRIRDEEPYGLVWQDSDLFKWYEGLCYTYAQYPDAELRGMIDSIASMLVDAQAEDGYYNAFFQLKRKGNRWENLRESHELYSCGHVIEACIAHRLATDSDQLLDVARKLADHICRTFGTGEGQLRGYPGHQEIELALVRLYRTTGERRYLDEAKYFIDERGKDPYYFTIEWERRGRWGLWSDEPIPRPEREVNLQTHLPLTEQTTAEGHAVRAAYMYAAMADIAAETNDERMLEQCRTLWDNIVERRIYLTGGVGSVEDGERFGPDYELPNKAYAETCAGIGMVFFAHRMFHVLRDGKYIDILERTLFNNVLGSTGLDAKTYFYTNVLECKPKERDRGDWQGCACCPTNIARFFPSMSNYVYSFDEEQLFVNLYAEGEATLSVAGTTVRIRQRTDYPWNGKVTLSIEPEEPTEFAVNVRLPGWCQAPEVSLNGGKRDVSEAANGYLRIERTWSKGDSLTVDLPMRAELYVGHPAIEATRGKVSVVRGPLVYCLEDKDNGDDLQAIELEAHARLEETFTEDFGGCVVIGADGWRATAEAFEGGLYRPVGAIRHVPARLRFIPYYAWNNRGNGEMRVWVWRK